MSDDMGLMMEDKVKHLKPCPYCGSQVRIEKFNRLTGMILCSDSSSCASSGLVIVFDWDLKDSALDQWNKRFW